MRRKLFNVVSILIIVTIHREIDGGFTDGAPCSQRNTAYLNPFRPQFPQDKVKCVDITAMGNTMVFHQQWPIIQADTLYADHMHLKNLTKTNIFAFLPNLEFIDMSGNEIRRLPVKMNRLAPRLTTFLLAKNRIVIPKRNALMRSLSLKTLMLSNNKIKAIQPNTFGKMPSLKVLYLDGNYIKNITPQMFKHLTNLKYLHLGNNFLKTVPSKALMPKSLTVYILKGNKLMDPDDLKA